MGQEVPTGDISTSARSVVLDGNSTGYSETDNYCVGCKVAVNSFAPRSKVKQIR